MLDSLSFQRVWGWDAHTFVIFPFIDAFQGANGVQATTTIGWRMLSAKLF